VLLAAMFVVPLGIVISIAAADGLLAPPHGWGRFGDDLRVALGSHTDLAATGRFQLLRDVPAQLLLIAAWALPALTYVQWGLFEKAFPNYVATNLIAFEADDRSGGVLDHNWTPHGAVNDQWGAIFAKVNTGMQRIRRWSRWILLASAALTALFYFVIVRLEHRSLFTYVTKSYRPAARLHVITGWWASWHHPVGMLLYGVSATVLLYYSLIANWAGLLYFWRLCLPQTPLVFNYDLFNRDGHYGWREARQLLFMTYRIFILDGLVIAGLLATFGVWGTVVVWIITGFFAVSFLFYLTIPSACFAVRRRRAKERDMGQLAEQARSNPAAPDFDSTVSMLDRVRAVPDTMLHMWQRSVVLVTSVGTILGLVTTILSLKKG
jgi:hypothetical protein